MNLKNTFCCNLKPALLQLQSSGWQIDQKRIIKQKEHWPINAKKLIIFARQSKLTARIRN